MSPVRLRFALSPTGRLHIGNCTTALFNWLFARREGGEFLVRIMLGDLKRETGRKGKTLLLPLRVGLTGRVSGPELGKLLPVIDIGSRLPLERPVASCLHRLGEMVRFLSGND